MHKSPKNKIVIAAANGFIGQALIEYFHEYEIVGLVRNKKPDQKNCRYVIWDGKTAGDWVKEIDGALAVINLAGRSVNCRYTEKNKAEIFSSRLDSTTIIGLAIRQSTHPPKVWINAGSATIYRSSTDKAMTEMNGEFHNDFSVQVCKAWEKCFEENNCPDTRKIFLRIAIVLGKKGGVYAKLRSLAKKGLGGRHGNGEQKISWIHEKDLCRIIDFIIHQQDAKGIYNAAAPGPLSNNDFMLKLRKSLGIKFGLPQPLWMLKLGTWLMRTEKELVLKSRYVIPERLLQNGYSFSYPTVDEAFEDLSR